MSALFHPERQYVAFFKAELVNPPRAGAKERTPASTLQIFHQLAQNLPRGEGFDFRPASAPIQSTRIVNEDPLQVSR